MTRSRLGEIPFNPFVSLHDHDIEDVLKRGFMVIGRDEVPTEATGFQTLAEREPDGSQRKVALGLAAAHVSWMAEFTRLPDEVIIADRRFPTDGSIRLVLSQTVQTS